MNFIKTQALVLSDLCTMMNTISWLPDGSVQESFPDYAKNGQNLNAL